MTALNDLTARTFDTMIAAGLQHLMSKDARNLSELGKREMQALDQLYGESGVMRAIFSGVTEQIEGTNLWPLEEAEAIFRYGFLLGWYSRGPSDGDGSLVAG